MEIHELGIRRFSFRFDDDGRIEIESPPVNIKLALFWTKSARRGRLDLRIPEGSTFSASASLANQPRISVRGDMLISTLNDKLEINLPHEESHTVGGLVMDSLGRIPQVGDAVEIAVRRTSGSSEPTVINLRVEAVDHRSVTEVCVSLPPEEMV